MNIEIVITDDDGEQIFRSESLSVESAVDELYRFERHKLPIIQIEDETI